MKCAFLLKKKEYKITAEKFFFKAEIILLHSYDYKGGVPDLSLSRYACVLKFETWSGFILYYL